MCGAELGQGAWLGRAGQAGPSLPQQTPWRQPFEDKSSSYSFALSPCPGSSPAGSLGPEPQRNLECCQAEGWGGEPWPLVTASLSASLCSQPMSGNDLIMDSRCPPGAARKGPDLSLLPVPLFLCSASLHSLPKTLLTSPGIPKSCPSPAPHLCEPETKADQGCCPSHRAEHGDWGRGSWPGMQKQRPSSHFPQLPGAKPLQPSPRRLGKRGPRLLGTRVRRWPFSSLDWDSECSIFCISGPSPGSRAQRWHFQGKHLGSIFPMGVSLAYPILW